MYIWSRKYFGTLILIDYRNIKSILQFVLEIFFLWNKSRAVFINSCAFLNRKSQNADIVRRCAHYQAVWIPVREFIHFSLLHRFLSPGTVLFEYCAGPKFACILISYPCITSCGQHLISRYNFKTLSHRKEGKVLAILPAVSTLLRCYTQWINLFCCIVWLRTQRKQASSAKGRITATSVVRTTTAWHCCHFKSPC